ncbi:hypothetical protein PSHT_05395 [Puccinia striiformis]|uniref:Uncharacterized protein n=3 Tax=Puccinia striiformis TaxID=27350 RepID=A0A0L0UZA6_9BASI|nr:hypothetical protein KEM48_011579 [Puccinia striiformis f. sp. tritici PST-130]KNE92251.1 hypothetical protein PSTG_14345 [Puccinia striiformis f. sp. tritici PST-78]POW08750.1 hypothetical protein PSTT_07277 [Puccinia striiformis]POW18775.1 hypothetical protein PSHT_05395 [Puccinia striiformis]
MGAAAMAGYKSRLVDSLGPFLIIISCNFKSPQDLVSRLSSCICCGHIHLTATLKVQKVTVHTLVLLCCRLLAHARRHRLSLRSLIEIINGILIQINQLKPSVHST